MILGRPTKFGTGIELFGDYFDLSSLHQTLHDISNQLGEDNPETDLFLGLAFDVRKAYEGSREEEEFGISEMDKVKYKGFKIMWHEIIVTLNIMRQRIGSKMNFHEHHANLYLLERVVVNALKEYDENEGKLISKWILEYTIPYDIFLRLKITEFERLHKNEKDGKARFKSINEKMTFFLPNSLRSIEFIKSLEETAASFKCRVKDLKLPQEEIEQIKFKW